MNKEHFESRTFELNDSAIHEVEKNKYANVSVSFLAKTVGSLLIFFGNLVYGKNPSYCKFKAVEVIARIPYQSWEVATYTLLTLWYSDEEKALELSKNAYFTRVAQDNETMHVVVMSELAKTHESESFLLHTIIPLLFSFIYFWLSFLLYIAHKKSSLEINYLFEQHAYEQYSEFLKTHEDTLRNTPIKSAFLDFYGRDVSNEYEFFQSVRNDELLHRNQSMEQIL